MDSLMKFIVTMSSDTTVRVYKNRNLKSQLQYFHKFVSIESCVITDIDT